MTARTKNIRPAGRTARTRALPFPLFLLMVCAAVTIGATALRALGAGSGASTGMGQAMAGTAGRVMAFMDYFAGVFTLLSLTAAVVCGLAATDRLVLRPRHRVAMQSVHRATAVAALGFLAIHIAVKVAEQDATPLAALLPFGGGATFAVGLGTLAADLLVLTAATGAVRGRFAGSRRPWLWRVLHCAAYASWPMALAHGLTAGRAAAVWVLWSYGLSVAMVGLALLVRVLSAAGSGSSKRRAVQTLLATTPRSAKEMASVVEEPVSLASRGQESVYAEIVEPAVEAQPVEAVPAETVTMPAMPVEALFAQAPAFAEPVFTEPAFAEPAFAQPGFTQPAFTQPGFTQPAYAQASTPDYAQPQHAEYPFQPQYPDYGGGYGYPAPSPWAGDGMARPHPTLTETPPHGFSVPGDLFATPYAPTPSPDPALGPDWMDDSALWAAWGALTWDTAPNGIPAVSSVYVTPTPEHGGGW